jgi:hypothetical protein
MALAMVPAGSSRPIEKIVPGPLCFDAHFGAPVPPAPGAAAPPRPPPSVRHWMHPQLGILPSQQHDIWCRLQLDRRFQVNPFDMCQQDNEHFISPKQRIQKLK